MVPEEGESILQSIEVDNPTNPAGHLPSHVDSAAPRHINGQAPANLAPQAENPAHPNRGGQSRSNSHESDSNNIEQPPRANPSDRPSLSLNTNIPFVPANRPYGNRVDNWLRGTNHHDEDDPDGPTQYLNWSVFQRHVLAFVDDRVRTRTGGFITINYLISMIMLAIMFFMADVYTGCFTGPQSGLLAIRDRITPSVNGIVSVADVKLYNHINTLTHDGFKASTRLSKLETFMRDYFDGTPRLAPKPSYKVNWFAAANGAIVDPYLSSPVDLICKGITEHTWYTWLLSVGGKCEAASYPPGQALRPWSEPDERWCAPPGRGKLQLAVLVSRPLAPTDLIIEHYPKDASLFIGDAPKEIELWVDVPDKEVNAKVQKAVGRMFPNYFFTSSPQYNRELDEKQALPATFIPVGRWTYNIWEDEHIQSFHIPIPLKELGVKSNRFAVRVNSNWGDYGATCIYRARLHAHDVSGIKEDLEEDTRKEAWDNAGTFIPVRTPAPRPLPRPS